MKTLIKSFINFLLSFFNISIIHSRDNVYDINCIYNRIKKHGFEFDTLIDIGAADGSWAINFKKKFQNVSILAIEPLIERIPILERKLMNYENKYVISNCIAGENNFEFNLLNVSKDLDGSTVDGTDEGESRSIVTRSIDSLIHEHKFKGKYIIKFDTHGFELPILNGMEKTLKETEVIIMECYNFRITKNALLFHEMCYKLNELGFSCYDISNPVLRPFDNAFWQIDILFCKSSNKIFQVNNYNK
jgi:FkbM family methyltransferase